MADKKYYSEEQVKKIIKEISMRISGLNLPDDVEGLNTRLLESVGNAGLTIPESEVTAEDVAEQHFNQLYNSGTVDHDWYTMKTLQPDNANSIISMLEEYRVLSFAKAQKIDDYKELYEQGLVIINELSKQNDGLQLLIDEKQKVKLPSDDEMVSKMGKIAHERSSSHNNQYGAYKMGFRDCYEWMLDQIKKQIEK